MNLKNLGRLIWPEHKTFFLTGGLAVGLIADVSSFLSNLGSPLVLIWPALGLMLLFGFLCLPRLSSNTEGSDGVECPECGALRLTLYSIVALGLLILAGQGTSATERIGAQLGLIQRDVSVIREDVSAIREVTADSELVRNPRTAADRFRNAWLYANYRRDNENAWREIQALYAEHTPNKIDAAELFFRTGLALTPRDQLIAQMIEVGRTRRDAAMLVVTAAQMTTYAEAEPLMTQAREFDPDMPFAHWMQSAPMPLHDGSAQQRYDFGLAEIAQYEAFLAAAARRRPAEFYFLPQYTADWEALVQTQLQRERERVQRLEQRLRR